MILYSDIVVMKQDYYKIVLLGQATVGKTSITGRITTGEFHDGSESTIGASFTQLIRDGVKLCIWDTAGQERYRAISEIYYRDSDLALLVFDLTDINTIKEAYKYKQTIVEKVKDYDLIVIGNKLDLVTDKQRLDELKDACIEVFNDVKLEYIVFVSAKDNNGIEDLIDKMVYKAKTKIGSGDDMIDEKMRNIIELSQPVNHSHDSSCSC